MSRLICVDSHVIEDRSLWTHRLADTKWADAVPRLVSGSDEDWWIVDGVRIPLKEAIDVGAIAGDPAEGPLRWGDVPAAARDPHERLVAMDTDEVEAAVLYPMLAGSAGERLLRLDRELAKVCITSYNDWLIDVWGATSERLIPQCLTPVWPVDDAVAEVRRSVARGHRGVIFPPVPTEIVPESPHINSPQYDPLWAVCEELQVPLAFHSGVVEKMQFAPYSEMTQRVQGALRALTGPVSSSQILVNFLFSPIPQRHPLLKVIFSESSLAWGAYVLETADHQYERQRLEQIGYEFKPSEIFGRQCFLAGWFDRKAIELRHDIGVENMLWQSTFPKATSTWPNTSNFIKEAMSDVPTSERRKIQYENAKLLYRL